MSQFHTLANANYISIESYRRNGQAVQTPVWLTHEGESLFCWTLANSGKVKRIRQNPRVRLACCNASGAIKGEWVEAVGRVLDTREEVSRQTRQMSAKYSLKFLPFRLIGLLRRTKAVALEFSPADTAAV